LSPASEAAAITKKEARMEKDTRLNVRVPEQLRWALKVEAARQGRTIADVVRDLVEAWLDQVNPDWAERYKEAGDAQR